MKCVIPLAGPDLWHADHGFRPLVPVEDEPLLRRALAMRAWAQSLAPTDYVFVVRRIENVESLICWLTTNWPGCRIVHVSALTEGALFSALAGVAAYTGDNEPVVIDLADILFEEGPADIDEVFQVGKTGMIVPTFSSDDPVYSYVRSENGQVVEAAEKRVISNAASAGVYIFRDRAMFLAAAAHSIRHRAELEWKGSLFLCPMVNGVLAAGFEVSAPDVRDVRPAGRVFHKKPGAIT